MTPTDSATLLLTVDGDDFDARLPKQGDGVDLAVIAVEIDGEWIEVPSVFARHQGVRAATWRQACDELRARFKHEAALDEHIVHKAIDDIEQINGEAMKRVGLLSEDWSKEQLEKEEKNLFVGFAIEPDAFFEQEGCEIGRKVFLSPRWSSIDLG